MVSTIQIGSRFSGVLLHPSSLPGDGGYGNFGEASRQWIELLAKNEISVWQFLPLSPTDSSGSPYSSPSSFAFNPWFLDANDLATEGFISETELNKLPQVLPNEDSSRINFSLANLRSELVGKALLKKWRNQDRERHIEFEIWSSNQFWLDDHACFMELRNQHSGLPWWEWPKCFSSRNLNVLRTWKNKHKNNLLIHRLLQWHLARQWNSLRRLAKKNGIILFGDLPFYVSRDSADVWCNPSLFSIISGGSIYQQSGVPPDYFSETGQLWGNPVYRWEKHRFTGFKWWRRRFTRQWSQVDILRLDHFRALNSYWSVPGNQLTAENGRWCPSPGLQLLSFLRQDYGSKLPLVAEDLGLITSDVNQLRDYFNLPGMKILQFAFDGNPSNPYLPENIKGPRWVVYTGTHDNSTTNGWWDEMETDVKSKLFEKYKGDFDSPSWKLIDIGMQTDSYLFVSPLQDILSLGNEARFNKPGTLSNDNWTWKLKDLDANLIQALNSYGKLSSLHGRSFINAHKNLLRQF